MCYDVSFTVNIKQLSDYFPDLGFDEPLEIDFDQHHNLTHIVGHAYGEHPIIYVHKEDTAPHCSLMEWGVITYYTKDEEVYKRQRALMLNIRSERVLDDPKSYWYKIRNKRCLVPITGFYEHREVEGLKKKIPYFLRLKDQPLMYVPGLYSVAELPDKTTGEMIKRYTYGIITREANSLIKQIHNGGENKWRMPLMLPLELSKNGLNRIYRKMSIEQYWITKCPRKICFTNLYIRFVLQNYDQTIRRKMNFTIGRMCRRLLSEIL